MPIQLGEFPAQISNLLIDPSHPAHPLLIFAGFALLLEFWYFFTQILF